MPSSLPEPFKCPRCGAEDVVVNADVLVWLRSLKPLKGADLELADNAKWHCEECKDGGEVDESGPVAAPAPNDPVALEEHENLRFFRRIALDFLPLLNRRGLLGGSIESWENQINQASLSILLGIIITLQSKMWLPDPEYDDPPEP